MSSKKNNIRRMTNDEAIKSLEVESDENCGIVLLPDYSRESHYTTVVDGYLIDPVVTRGLSLVAKVYSIYTDYEQNFTNRKYYIISKDSSPKLIEIRGLDLSWEDCMKDIDTMMVYEFCSCDKLNKSIIIDTIKCRLDEASSDEDKLLVNDIINELKGRIYVYNKFIDDKPNIFQDGSFLDYYISVKYREELDDALEEKYDKGRKEIEDIMLDKSSAIYSVSENSRTGTMYDKYYDKIIEFSSIKYHGELCDAEYYFYEKDKSNIKLKLIVRITDIYSSRYDEVSYKIDSNYINIDKSSLPTELSEFMKLLFKDIDSEFVMKYWENVSLVTDVDGINPNIYSKDSYFNFMGKIFASSDDENE